MAPKPSQQQGVILLEALIGILIFSLGVLALVAMQAVSVSNISNASYRTEAAFLANEIIGEAWIDKGPMAANLDTYAVSSGSAINPQTQAWVAKIYATLPGSNANPPSIVITPFISGHDAVGAALMGGRQLTVTVRWRAPDAVTASNHVAVAYISDSEYTP